MKTPQIVIGIVAALALAGGGFAAGMTFDKIGNDDAAFAEKIIAGAARSMGITIDA